MARNIALGIKIQIDGGTQTIKTIDELEASIRTLNDELRNTEVGTQRFDEIVGDISKLKAGLRDVNREIEGVDKQQQFELFASSVNGVTGAFLVATSAAQAFGVEGKSLEEIQKLQARALALVNVALGVRQVLEAGMKFQLLQRTLAEKVSIAQTFLATQAQAAYTAVVGASTGALKAFRIALATTGIGALVVGIGFLISKLMSAKKETEETAEEIKKLSQFQLEATQNARAQEISIRNLTKVIKQADVPLEDRVSAYQELVKLVPELSGYTLQQAEDEGILNKAIEDQITLIQLRARATALESFLVESEKRRLAQEEEIRLAKEQTEAIGQLFEAQQEYNRAVSGGFAGTFEEYVEQQRQYGRVILKNKENTEDQTVVERELLEVQNEISELQGNVDRRAKKRAADVKAYTDRQKELTDAFNKQAKALSDAAKALGQYTLEGEVSVQVLDTANEILEKQIDLLDKRTDALTTDKEKSKLFTDELQNLLGGLIIPDELPVSINDAFAEVFSNVQQFAFENEDVFSVQSKLLTEIKNKGAEILKQTQNLNAEQVAALTEEQKIAAFREKVGDDSLAILLDYYQTNIDIVNDLERYNDQAQKTNERAQALNKYLAEGAKIQERKTASFVEFQELINKVAEAETKGLENLKSESQISAEINQLVAERLFGQDALINDLLPEEVELVENTVKALREQSKLYQGIYDVQRELAKLTKEITENAIKQQDGLADTTGLEAFIKTNKDKIGEIDAFFQNLKKKLDGATEDERKKITQLTDEQIDGIQNTIDRIKFDEAAARAAAFAQKIYAVYSDLSSRISQVVSAQNSLLLEQLQYQQDQTLATIGDSTEEAAAEREKVEKEYAQKRFDLEKKSRISELQFILADAIANAATSILTTYSQFGFPLGIPLAAAVGVISAKQIATINSQIGFARSQQFIGRRGLLVEGNSHEMGGVNFGGYNLEGGEAVIPRSAVSQYGDILSQMSMSVGGRPLTMDDSRIVEEIRRQNQRPIKTYVLDQDIQDTRKINARLEEISRL